MNKLTKQHISFVLDGTLKSFIALKNRALLQLKADTHHFALKSVDSLKYSFASDFTSFSVEATTAVSSYDSEGNADAVQRTIDIFTRYNWTKMLPEMLASAYKLDVSSMPTERTVNVEEQAINNRIIYKHSISFKARSYEAVERVVSAYHNAKVKKPEYFRAIEVKGTSVEKLKVDHSLYLSRGFTFSWSNDNHTINDKPFASMIFKHRFLDFSANSRTEITGIHHETRTFNEEVKLSLNIHTAIEAVIETSTHRKHVFVNLNGPIMECDNRIFINSGDLDFTELLAERATKAMIKGFLLSKAVKGAKVTMLKTHSIKRNVALSNSAKYKGVTFIGSLWGHSLMIEINKAGTMKVTDHLGEGINQANLVERVQALMTKNLSALFSNDREYASYLISKELSPKDADKAIFLFA